MSRTNVEVSPPIFSGQVPVARRAIGLQTFTVAPEVGFLIGQNAILPAGVSMLEDLSGSFSAGTILNADAEPVALPALVFIEAGAGAQ